MCQFKKSNQFLIRIRSVNSTDVKGAICDPKVKKSEDTPPKFLREDLKHDISAKYPDQYVNDNY